MLVTQIKPLQRRLKGLDEFKTPAFVGRMDRVVRRRKLVWWVMMAGGVTVGAAIGLLLL
jgi:hypothetical protein